MSFGDIIKAVLPLINANNPRLSLVQKAMNRLIAERDISAQELQHYIQGLPLSQCSREIIIIDCRPLETQRKHFYAIGGEIFAGKTIYERYFARRDADNISFLEWILYWDHKTHRRRPRARPRVPLHKPLYKGDPNHDDYQDFCRVKVGFIFIFFRAFFLN
jgi:hypothetical protein